MQQADSLVPGQQVSLGEALKRAPAARTSAGRIRATALPKLRDQTRQFTAAPSYDESSVSAEPLLPQITRHLEISELYWVSVDMAALAVSAGAALDLDEIDFDVCLAPSRTGLLLFDGGVGAVTYGDIDCPVDAVSWGPMAGGRGLLLCFYVARWRIRDGLSAADIQLDDTSTPPLIPISTTEDVGATGSADRPADTVRRALIATWHLMQQPTVAWTGRAEPDKKTARAHARLGKAVAEVNIIDLRRLYQATDPDHEPEEKPGRYSHRWVVTGHWRNQPHGPDRAQRKRIWIPDHVKGPDGAPLLVRERVNVWRR
ncbi:hypothetical protein [Nocardia thailandica]|uniref:hypothetical protein n=1 Tax=Nocardia thailandica TaxID=257275 RepID=UPI0005B8A434|nr:hypothetical protein [Nocardia thailandica]